MQIVAYAYGFFNETWSLFGKCLSSQVQYLLSMQQPKPRTPFYWYLTLFLVLSIGVLGATYAGFASAKNIRSSLLERATTISHLISADTIAQLNANDSDLQNKFYQDLKESLTNVEAANHDVRFVYLLAQNENGQAFFYVDSVNPANEEDYSPPGQLYPEGDTDVQHTYSTKTGEVLPITSDRWGNWLSAFSPVMDKDGNVVAILGMDVSADYFYRAIALNVAIPILLTSLILIILFWIKHRLQYQQRSLSEKAFFLSFAGHEIRSPLTAVAAALKKLPADTADQPTIKKVNGSLRHILDILDDVLSLQANEGLKAQGIHKKPTHIHDIIDDSIESLKLLSEQRGSKVVDVTKKEDEKLVVTVDPLLFERVISNFLVNAIKYSPDNSTIEVEVSHTPKKWQIRFHNEGDPIPVNEQKKLLRGFYRTKQARKSGQKGTGLGLVLVRDIINEHNGQLSLDSGPGRGVTFTITLPYSDI